MAKDPASTAEEPRLAGAGADGTDRHLRMQGAALPNLDAVKAKLAAQPEERPRNRRITSELAPRDHVLPVPNGWYALVRSETLWPGDVVTLDAVGQPLVVFRDDEGEAHVVEPYCPHMGAHLGGGKVLGCRLQCPYHGWIFDGTGRCVEIPYTDARIPARARVGAPPVREQDGFVYVWYHAGGAEPDYEVPRVDEHDDPAWSGAHVFETELVAALQEMAENNVDFAHFKYVHGRDIVPVGTSEHHFDGPTSWVEENLGEGLSFTRHSYGPGVAVLRFTGLMTVVANTTPIDRGNCRLQWHFYFPLEVEPAAEDLILSVVGPWGLAADVPIWRDMKFQEHPVLVRGDGPIAAYRRWYTQFYAGN